MTQILELKGFDELEKSLGDLAQGTGPAAQKIVAGMGMCVKIVEGAIQNETPVNLGHLRASIQGRVYGTPIDLYGEVAPTGTPLAYALPVEYSRKAGKPPPLKPILFWVKRKKIQFSRKGKTLSFEQTANTIRWAIAKGKTRFQKQGGAKMFERGFEIATPHVEKLWDKILEDVVREFSK